MDRRDWWLTVLCVLAVFITIAGLAPHELLPVPRGQILNVRLRQPSSGMYREAVIVAQSAERNRFPWATKTWPMTHIDSVSLVIETNAGSYWSTWHHDGRWHSPNNVNVLYDTLPEVIAAEFQRPGVNVHDRRFTAELALIQSLYEQLMDGFLAPNPPNTTLFQADLSVFLSQTQRRPWTFWAKRSLVVFAVMSPLALLVIWLRSCAMRRQALRCLHPDVPLDPLHNALTPAPRR